MFEIYRVANSVALRCRDVDFMASLMLMQVADVVAACCVWHPGLADSRIKVSLNLAAEGRKWMGVVIVGTPMVGVCRHGGAEAGWAEEIEGVFSLWEKLAPKVQWELLVGSA